MRNRQAGRKNLDFCDGQGESYWQGRAFPFVKKTKDHPKRKVYFTKGRVYDPPRCVNKRRNSLDTSIRIGTGPWSPDFWMVRISPNHQVAPPRYRHGEESIKEFPLISTCRSINVTQGHVSLSGLKTIDHKTIFPHLTWHLLWELNLSSFLTPKVGL